MKKLFSIIASLVVAHICSFAQQNVPTAAGELKFPSPNKFHEMLTRSNGTWMGECRMQFSSEGQRVNSGESMMVNKMSSDRLYQISEVKGNIKPGGMGALWTGLRIAGYGNAKKLFTRAMMEDSPAKEGVVMEGQWDEAKRSITFPLKKTDSSGKERMLKEVYTIVDENMEVLEIYDNDQKTKWGVYDASGKVGETEAIELIVHTSNYKSLQIFRPEGFCIMRRKRDRLFFNPSNQGNASPLHSYSSQ